ncbi:DUF4214 domain-containing protein [Achromobacter sp. GG226]|uniref:DUF4214 domain-containing protein n=1 Tax=Verticiella alkaliphila TaxID=2779529 RepID=UPI001C0D13E5|nr:DUF4214 domain-containing protein [Verticiella sp. GG226]MBU4609732.1 DUF4214 domain-containing protein [Verticiella sp. GG226]
MTSPVDSLLNASPAPLASRLLLDTFDAPTINEAPIIYGIDGDLTLFTPGVPEYIDSIETSPGASFADLDNVHFAGGYLLITQTTGTANGVFSMDPSSDFSFGTSEQATSANIRAGDTVFVTYGGQRIAIGTVDTALDGQDGRALRIDFNASAVSSTADYNLAGLIGFMQYTAPTAGARSFEMVFNDGELDSAPVTFGMRGLGVTSVSANPASGTYDVGDTISITVTFTDVVDVFGTPSLALQTGSPSANAVYVSGSGTNTLTFEYVVQDGDSTQDLDYLGTMALSLNDNGGIVNGMYDASLVLPTPGSADSLAGNAAIVIGEPVVNEAPTFAPPTGGTSSIRADGFGRVEDMTIQPDGDIVVVGYEASFGGTVTGVRRMDADGIWDTAFATTSAAALSSLGWGLGFQIRSVLAQEDGKIVLAGRISTGNSNEFAAVRLNDDGTLDTSFNGTGLQRVTLDGGNAYGQEALLLADGKILLGGHVQQNGSYHYAAVRLDTDGTVDTTYGINGWGLVGQSTSDMFHFSMALEADGGVLLSGQVGTSAGQQASIFGIARLSADGNWQTDYAGTGMAKPLQLNWGSAQQKGIIVLPDGSSVVVGTHGFQLPDKLTVVRLDADGNLITSFGTGGLKTIDLLDEGDIITDIAVVDGKLIIVGETAGPTVYSVMLAMQLNLSDGSMDTTFGTDGVVTLPFGTSHSEIYSVVVQPDGKIVAAGRGDGGLATLRLNADGTLDTTFNTKRIDSLGSSVAYKEGEAAVVLDASVKVYDAELAAQGHYEGASVSLARQGGANADDVFSGSGLLHLDNTGDLVMWGNSTIGTYVQADGRLTITFNSHATQDFVNEALSAITYANISDRPPASVKIEWTFNDGNTGSQGSGGAGIGTGLSTVNITALNAPPVITSQGGGATASINHADGALVVTQVIATDADSDTVTYAIAGGADANLFVIDPASGQLSFADAPTLGNPIDTDQDGIYQVTVQASDGRGGVTTQALSIAVLSDIDGDGIPDIDDLDADGDGFLNADEDLVPNLYGHGNGDGNGDGTPDSQQLNVASLQTLGTGSPWATLEVAQGLALTDITNTPAPGGLPRNVKLPLGEFGFTISGMDIGGSVEVSFYVDAGQGINAFYKRDVLTNAWAALGTSSPVPNSDKIKVTFTLVDGGQFDADGVANGVIVDPGGLAIQAPLITSNGGDTTAAVSMAENGRTVTTVTATVPPGQTALTYAISGGADAALFTIDANTGVLRFLKAPDFETPLDQGGTPGDNIYEVGVSATDGHAEFDTQLLAVTVTDVDETVPTPPVPTVPPPVDDWAGLPDGDDDQVPASVENLVPGMAGGMQGDGNGDGIADKDQADVASLPWAQSPDGTIRFVTLTNAGGLALQAVRPVAVNAEALPAGLSLPVGLVAFSAAGLEIGASMEFTVYLDSDIPVNGYWKQVDGHWENIATSITEVGGKTQITFSIEDGGRYDADGVADGRIVDPGGPGWMTAADADSDGDQFPDWIEAANGLVVGVKDNDVLGSSKLFVMQMYRDFLGREAESDGLAYWQGRLENGTLDRAEITSEFLATPEVQDSMSAVARLYLGGLARPADVDGLSYWAGQIRAGESLAAVANQFAESAEFDVAYAALADAEFVAQAYLNVLGREADAQGQAYWLKALEGGASRGDILVNLTESTEHVALSANDVAVTLGYAGLLGRTADAAGYQFWSAFLEDGHTEEMLFDQFVASSEYHDRFLPTREASAATLVGVADSEVQDSL